MKGVGVYQTGKILKKTPSSVLTLDIDQHQILHCFQSACHKFP